MGGAVVNGVYTGKIGPCFRCEGKGYQTAADQKRNRYYDQHIRRVSI
jgi:predicted PP-loop superfamily ATPase